MSYRPTLIGENVTVGDYAVIGRGAHIGDATIIDDFCKIEPNVSVGRSCLLQYRAYLSTEVSVGDHAIIGGFVTERATIGSNSRIFGSIVHRHPTLPTIGWDDEEAHEPSAAIGSRVFIGFGAIIIGAVSLADDVYVAAGALVTRDVPSFTLVRNINEHLPVLRES
jgi:UDP-3-O-[3-hydroxymyristoyl] glucosamine N-acyltransferase